MERTEKGEILASEEFIREDRQRNELIHEVIERYRARRIDDKVAGLAYQEEWKLMFYGQAVTECIEIARSMIKAPIKIVENVKVEFQTCTRERPVVGGTCMGSQRCGSICGTIGWVANKPSVSRGIITVAHAVNPNDWVYNNRYIDSDKIARAETIVDDSYVDAAYCPFVKVDGSPAIKNLGLVVAWMGYNSVPLGLSISFSGYGSSRRRDTKVVAKGYLAGKFRQIAVEPITVGGDSGAAYANYNPDTGKWVLVGLHRVRILVDSTPQYSIGSAVDEVNNRTGTYPYLS